MNFNVMAVSKKLLYSFGWIKQPYQGMFVAAILVLSVGLGVVAYQKPLRYNLDVGGADSPFTRDMASRNMNAVRTSRWTEADSGIVIPGISASHPLTLSLYISGEARADVQSGKEVSFTLSINGHQYPVERLPTSYSWLSWQVDREVISNGELDIHLSVPPHFGGVLIWPVGLLLDQVTLEPASDTRQPLADYAELDWRSIAYLALIVLLTYSFFAGANRRWLVLLGLLFSLILTVVLALLLANNRPLFVTYASSIALALLIIRLTLPLIRGVSGRRHPALWLFGLALASSLLLMTPGFQSYDDAIKYLTAESLLTRGTLQLPPGQLDSGSHYSRYGLGHPIAELPLLALGLGVQQLNGAPDSIRYLFVMLLDPIMSALGVALLFLCAKRMFGSERLAIILSLIYFFSTFAFVFATQSWSEPIVTTLLLLAFYAMLRVFTAEERQQHTWLMVTGFALGYALITRPEYVIVAAIFGLWWAARRGAELRQEGRGWGKVGVVLFSGGLRLAVPLMTFVLLDLSYNYVQSGSLFMNSYSAMGISLGYPWLSGVYGLLISSGKGLVLYAPPVIHCLWAGSRLWRKYRWEATLIGLVFGVMLIFYATYPFWQGGATWGPRFLLPTLPLLILASGAALAVWGEWKRWQRGGYVALILIGSWVAMMGALTSPLENWMYGRGNLSDSVWASLAEFAPTHTPIVNAWNLVQVGYTQSQAVFQLSWYHFPTWADHIVPGLLLALVWIVAIQMARALGEPMAVGQAGRAASREAVATVGSVEGQVS